MKKSAEQNELLNSVLEPSYLSKLADYNLVKTPKGHRGLRIVLMCIIAITLVGLVVGVFYGFSSGNLALYLLNGLKVSFLLGLFTSLFYLSAEFLIKKSLGENKELFTVKVFFFILSGIISLSLVKFMMPYPFLITNLPFNILLLLTGTGIGFIGFLITFYERLIGELTRLLEDLQASYLSTIQSLILAMEAKDPYTKGHSERVARYTYQLGKAMGFSGKELEILYHSALFHDIGKVGLDERIINKDSPLTADEWDIIQLHPVIATNILGSIKFICDELPSIRHHHERYGGGGYPDKIKGEEIPLAARVIAVADSYDAMTSERPYRQAFTHEQAVTELKRCAGTQFDPAIVEVFVKCFCKEEIRD